MRKVTCRVAGEIGYSNEFYKAPNGKYYKSKELYESTMVQREYRTKILYLINSDILKLNPKREVLYVTTQTKSTFKGANDYDKHKNYFNNEKEKIN